MTAFCTYLYKDPKSLLWRYVGKGIVGVRPQRHFYAQTRLGHMLRKRISEGFTPEPHVILAESEADALEMEGLLIAMIGREDLNTGSLFNVTNGGEKGVTGRKASALEKAKRLATMRAKPEEEQAEIKLKIQVGRASFVANNPEKRQLWIANIATGKCKPCTVDGITIYDSKEKLIVALGQGKAGRRSPSFRYV